MQHFGRIYWLSTHFTAVKTGDLPENMNKSIEYVDVRLAFYQLSSVHGSEFKLNTELTKRVTQHYRHQLGAPNGFFQ